MSKVYRPEVDGLRAIAVVPVVLYHAGISVFAGGYVGVDIFFVISGYLITGILLRSTQSGSFSLAEFYERRIRRIFPALFTVLCASSICAGWLMFPDELTNYGKSLFATSLFYANYHFMYDTGYFAAPAEGKPLLHMWSLAVEEQFYLLFPLYIYALWRWCKRWRIALTVSLCVASFAYSVWLMRQAPDQAFYSAPARAWELLVGALVAMASQTGTGHGKLGERPGNLVALLGLTLIAVPVAGYSQATQFPGAMAVPPVFGAALVIYATQARGNLIARLLSTAPFRFTGLISYSLYLWHWPVFVFYKAYAIAPVTGQQTAWLLLAAVLLSVASWRFVEQPFRVGVPSAGRRQVLGSGIAIMGIGIACGAAVAISDGFPGRFSPTVIRTLEVSSAPPEINICPAVSPANGEPLRLCSLGVTSNTRPNFAVWGDSHAEALIPAIATAARQSGARGVAYVRGGCPALLGVRQARDGFRDCDTRAEEFMAFLAANPEIERVILVSRWALYAMGERFKSEPGHTVFITDNQAGLPSLAVNQQVFERGLARTLSRLESLGRRVVFVTQVPEAEYRVPMAMARAEHLSRRIEFAPTYAEYRIRQSFVESVVDRQRLHRQMLVVRPELAMCPGERCLIMSNGLPIYRDSNHLTETQAASMADVFKPLFDPSFKTNALSSISSVGTPMGAR